MVANNLAHTQPNDAVTQNFQRLYDNSMRPAPMRSKPLVRSKFDDGLWLRSAEPRPPAPGSSPGEHTFDFSHFIGMPNNDENRDKIVDFSQDMGTFLQARSGQFGIKEILSTGTGVTFKEDYIDYSKDFLDSYTLKINGEAIHPKGFVDLEVNDVRFTPDFLDVVMDFGKGYTAHSVSFEGGRNRNKRRRLRRHMKSNLLIKMKSRHDFITSDKVTPQEIVARHTLRDMISEKEWRGYVTNGFILVKGGSGKWYQIFNNRFRTVQVYLKGRIIGSLCIHTDSACPPTDHLINMKLMIELDENLIWSGSNKRFGCGDMVWRDPPFQEPVSLLKFAKSIAREVQTHEASESQKEYG